MNNDTNTLDLLFVIKGLTITSYVSLLLVEFTMYQWDRFSLWSRSEYVSRETNIVESVVWHVKHVSNESCCATAGTNIDTKTREVIQVINSWFSVEILFLIKRIDSTLISLLRILYFSRS